jgi:hypothetical protein
MGRACSAIVEERNTCRILVGKLQGTRPLGRSRLRCIYNIDIGLRVGWGDMNWIDVTQDRNQWRALVNTIMKH